MKRKKYLRKFLIVSTLAAAITAIINKIIFYYATVRNFLYNPSSHTFSWRFGDISYTKEGEGKPLLLVHDLKPFASSYEWSKVKRELSKEHTVYTLDLLGCGQSDKPKLTYTNFLYVQLLSDFTKTVIGEKTDIITSGAASSLAIMAAGYHSDLYDKILFINPEALSSANRTPDRHSRRIKALIELPVIGTLIYNISYKQEAICNYLMDQGFSDCYRVSSDDIYAYHEASHLKGTSSRFLFASIQGGYTSIPVTNVLKNLKNDLYLLAGSSSVQEYSAVNPSIRSHTLNHPAGLPHLENPEAFLKAVKKLLEV